MLKCVSRAARNRIRNAPITATIAKRSGITVGTSARNSTSRITNATASPMKSLRPCVGGALSASPVNSTWSAGRVADRVQLVFERDDARPRKLEPVPVVLHVEERDAAVVGQLIGAGRKRIRDVRRVLGILGERVLRSVAGREHPPDRSGARRCVEALAGRRGDHDAQRGSLLPAELGIDQVDRLLRVRARDLEVVDELAVERRVEPDQHDEDATPRGDHPPRMACEMRGGTRERARVGDALLLREALFVHVQRVLRT